MKQLMIASLALMLLLTADATLAAVAADEPGWSAVVLPQTGEIPALVTGVAAGPDRLVAVGERTCELKSDAEDDLGRCWGQAWISADGREWEAVEAPTSGLDLGMYQYDLHGPELGLADVAYGPGGFVAYGWAAPSASIDAEPETVMMEPTLWRSDDGTSWSRVPPPEGFSASGLGHTGPRLRAMAGTDDGYLLGGTIYGRPAPRAAIWSSPDGLEWTLAGPVKAFDVGAYIDTMEVPFAGGITAFAVEPASDGSTASLIAVGSSCPKAKADAGPKGRRWQRWDWTTGRCRARIWRSDDGTTWKARSLRDTSGSRVPNYAASTVAATEDATVIGAVSPEQVLHSRDGATWTAGPVRKVSRQRALAASRNGFLAAVPRCVDERCRRRTLVVWSSDDGAQWNRDVLQPSLPIEVEQFIHVDTAVYGDRMVVTASSWADAGVGSLALLGPPVDAASSPVIPSTQLQEPATERSGPLESGLSVLTERPFRLGWGAIFDVVSTGDKLVAVGYAATYDKSHGAAWTSQDGRKWRKSHRLPPWYFYRAIPLADGTVLASRDTTQGCSRLWRLEPDGRVRKAGLIWPSKRDCPKRTEVVALAGRPGAGMVAVYGGLGRADRPEVVARAPGARWEHVRVPGLGQAFGSPVAIADTASGFVLVAEAKDAIRAWRSPDGREWTNFEPLPDSMVDRRREYAPTSTIYDAERDILLVLASPARVWRSVAGGPFESVGPLAARVEHDGSRLVGVALADGFLVATSSDEEGVHLQTSPDGVTWTRADQDPDYMRAFWMVTHGDRVLVGSESGGPILGGPATIMAYLLEHEVVSGESEA